jgi:hypothetical protein
MNASIHSAHNFLGHFLHSLYRHRLVLGTDDPVSEMAATLNLLAACLAGFVKPPPSTTPGGLVVEYFAIGSNMQREVLTGRRGITPVAPARPAVAPDHALTFDVPGFSVLEPAFAAIEPRETSECHGVLYTLSPSDWLRLLASEGVPFAYRPLPLTVECYDGRRVQAVSFAVGTGVSTANALFRIPARSAAARNGDEVGQKQQEKPRPSQRYLALLRDGAREAGLAETWIAYLDALQPAPGSSDAPNSRPQPKRNYEQRQGATFV